MTLNSPSIKINLDLTNPGHYFACMGLLELADRLWGEAHGWFVENCFLVATGGDLSDLLNALRTTELRQLDPANNTSSPIEVGTPFRTLRLDWWQDILAGGREMKVWAGRMDSVRIARAMQHAMRNGKFDSPDLLEVGVVAYNPDSLADKVEPFYFDARRCPNAHSRDVGFSPDALKMTTTAFPAVELLCLCGLQRCLPARTQLPRVFDYFTWSEPLSSMLAGPASAGVFRAGKQSGYRFENWYRTAQKKHKAFRSATQIL